MQQKNQTNTTTITMPDPVEAPGGREGERGKRGKRARERGEGSGVGGENRGGEERVEGRRG